MLPAECAGERGGGDLPLQTNEKGGGGADDGSQWSAGV